MKSNYRFIGDYIQKVEHRNRDLKITRLLGLSMTKEFRETTSNIVGTDMSVYRVMSKYQFACDFMSPIRVNKLPVVLKLDDEPNLVSPAYPVFEIKDRNELDPEYLMMWFRRTEFDRYAAFKCDAAIRGGYEWKDLCETQIPIPSITKQIEIVKEYNVIQNRIAINHQLIHKLEEAAQTIYKQWFVDFEFPDKNGRPYKSSGGEMVFNEELQKEIPLGWVNGFLSMISKKIYSGGTPSTEVVEYWNGEFSWFSSGETGKKYIHNTERTITKEGIKHSTTKRVKKLSTVIATAGQGKTRGQSALLFNEVYINQSVIAIEPLKVEYSFFIFLDINSRYDELRNDSDSQSIRGSINTNDIKGLKVVVPIEDVLVSFYETVSSFFEIINNKTLQNQKLSELKDLLLSKLATLDN